MVLFKIIAVVFLVALFFIFRKWFLKHNYILLLFIPFIILIIYSDYFIKIGNTNKQGGKAELEKWKQEHKDNFINPEKYNSKDVAISKRKIGDVLYDTTFNVNSLKVHYKEFLVALPANVYSYASTKAVLDIIDKNDSTIQTIYEDIYALSSPIDKDDGYNILEDDGIFLDYNFDGYLDIILRVGNGRDTQALNGDYYLYLFDPGTRKFNKFNKMLYNPVPDNEKKMIKFFNIISSYDDHTLFEYYKWSKNSLVLKESIESIFIPEESDEHISKYKVTTTYYENGKAKIKSQRIDEIIYDNF
jgi:hypothetical protein